MPLTDEDKRVIEEWIASGLLRLVKKLPSDFVEFVLLTCGDGHIGIPFFYAKIMPKGNVVDMTFPHLLTQNGGYLRDHDWATRQITGSHELKKTNNLIICGHGPCGKAGSLPTPIGVADQLADQRILVESLKTKFTGLNILSHFHIRNGSSQLYELVS